MSVCRTYTRERRVGRKNQCAAFLPLAEDARSLVSSTFHLPRSWAESALDQVRVSWLGAHVGCCWGCSATAGTRLAGHRVPQQATPHRTFRKHRPDTRGNHDTRPFAHTPHIHELYPSPHTNTQTHEYTDARTRTHETGRPLTDTAIHSLDLRLGLVYAVEDALDARELQPATFGNVLGEVLRVWLRLVCPGAGPTRGLRRLEVGHG
mmetsp:Transcript_38488/g.110053  ORF Transcript_38488/g.110053 Transcript_38488/m.110053 type:complete len:207 (-) Transcript_38488:1920-2540(-)